MDHNHPELGSGVWRIKYHVRRTASRVIEHDLFIFSIFSHHSASNFQRIPFHYNLFYPYQTSSLYCKLHTEYCTAYFAASTKIPYIYSFRTYLSPNPFFSITSFNPLVLLIEKRFPFEKKPDISSSSKFSPNILCVLNFPVNVSSSSPKSSSKMPFSLYRCIFPPFNLK